MKSDNYDDAFNNLYGLLLRTDSTESESLYFAPLIKKKVKFGEYYITILLDDSGRFKDVISVEKKESFYNKNKFNNEKYLSATDYLNYVIDTDK